MQNKVSDKNSDAGIVSPDTSPIDLGAFKLERSNIHLDNYLKFYYLHVFYYSTLGPLFFLLFFWISWVRSSLKNLLFIRLNPWCAFQNLYWSTCAIVFIFSVILNNTGYSYTTIEVSLLYCTLINTFFRAATISGKYGTYPRSEIDKIMGDSIEPSAVRGEMMIDAWNRQEPEIVKSEIWVTDRTFGYEPHSKVSVDGVELYTNDLVTKLVDTFNRTWPVTIAPTIAIFILGATRAVCHGLLNLACGIRFHGDTVEEAILFYFIALFQFMYYTVAPMFFLLLMKDISRHKFLTRKAV